jgi:sugar phosphate isomerase/epimerase
MKLAVSNIAWKNNQFDEFLKLISSLNCSGVEIAPSKLWKRIENIDDEDKKNFKAQLKNFNLKFLGFHSLLFGKENLQIFKDNDNRKETKLFLYRLVEVCHDLGGRNLIFGSPKNRNTHNKSNYKEIGKNFFFDLSNYAEKFNINICLEPLDVSMTDFLTTIESTGEFIEDIGNSNLKLHIDTKSFLISKEKIGKNISRFFNLIEHVHISNSDLSVLKEDNKIHKMFANYLREMKYSNYLSLEMRRVNNNEIGSITESVDFIKKIYLSKND